MAALRHRPRHRLQTNMTGNASLLAAAVRGFVFALLLTAAAAHAQTDPETDADRCASITNNSDLAIQHCTRAIDSKRYAGGELARLRHNRGVEYLAKGQLDQAIADLDAAIRLDANFGDAYYHRGNAWSARGDSARAIADFDVALKLNPKDRETLASRAYEWVIKGDYARAVADRDAAVRLDPKSSEAIFGRARARFYAGDYTRAIADLEEAFRIDAGPYAALWLYLARQRAGVPEAAALLGGATAEAQRTGWPGPVLTLYLGRMDVASVMNAATDRDAKLQREQRCEANFYVAHWHLIQGRREPALALLKEARAGCPKDFLEYEGAAAELQRLSK